MMELMCEYIFLFFAFSFMGWCMEVILKYREYHRFINRGFYIGPYCPIYGTGAVIITLAIRFIAPFEASYGMTYVVSFIICGVIEYLVSYYLEKKYHARWWDYSKKPMNLNGRVWIGNLILFGIGGLAIVKILDPFLIGIFYCFKPIAREGIVGLIVIIFGIDVIFSTFVMKLVKAGIEKSEADNTEAISKEIKMLLAEKSVFYRRFSDAYPEVIYQTDKISKRINEVKQETERIRLEVEKKLNDVNEKIEAGKEQFAMDHEPIGLVKNTIIEKQDKLIEMLMEEEKNMDEIQKLKDEIDVKKENIKNRQGLLSQYM